MSVYEGVTCYEQDEELCADPMCQRTGCRLRNARLATPAPGYAQFFEACREAAKKIALHRASVWKTSDGKCSMSLWDECSDIAAAIAALPAPAWVEVTVEELVRIIDPGASALTREYNYAIDLAKQLLAAFTILAKPTQEGQGS